MILIWTLQLTLRDFAHLKQLSPAHVMSAATVYVLKLKYSCFQLLNGRRWDPDYVSHAEEIARERKTMQRNDFLFILIAHQRKWCHRVR